MPNTLTTALMACVLLLGLSACTPESTPVEDARAEPAIEVGNAFIAVPIEGRDLSMGGMDIAVGNAGVRLVDVSGGVAETIELHTMEMVDGRMRMRQVTDGIAIAPGETLQLQRGGDHLMLFGVADVLPGEGYSLQLGFETEDGERIVVDVVATGVAIGE